MRIFDILTFNNHSQLFWTIVSKYSVCGIVNCKCNSKCNLIINSNDGEQNKKYCVAILAWHAITTTSHRASMAHHEMISLFYC